MQMTTAPVSVTPSSLRSLRWTQRSQKQGAASRADILVVLHRLRWSGRPPQLTDSLHAAGFAPTLPHAVHSLAGRRRLSPKALSACSAITPESQRAPLPRPL